MGMKFCYSRFVLAQQFIDEIRMEIVCCALSATDKCFAR
jgi:hypothetical protein